METKESYLKFDPQDRLIMRRECFKRWKGVAKTFIFTFALPFFCGNQIISVVNLVAHGNIGSEFDDVPLFKLLMLLWTPVFFIIGLANAALFLRNIPFVYVDILRGKKKIFEFSLSKYTLPEFDRYYIQTPLSDFPFFEVSYDTYCSLNENDLLSLAIAPQTKTVLYLKNEKIDKLIDYLPS